ncbi:Arp Ankyrin repeat [Pyrenophora tritici-repentis]|uniref:Ankyrin-1 n=1 Tax=Pyrenophora tritici-repentis TaxID=45151 RepID=A0A2W1EDB7_9PLEO|nr:putativeankyrin-1-like [Pyrenophora tritici-repentis]KAG9382640.1 ankyrin-1 [Pyrenophora tritici-repentis]KAI0573482.1 ankyrin-1-like [Pyrenophora tritici-repentis]KAI1510265.1 ankyrin-1 [Pyrenophora tritici-repentis]KAI1535991.1 Arp Ankyrin repeat [Pyrenophora tritici-repentis]
MVTEAEKEIPSTSGSALAAADKGVVGGFNTSILLQAAASGNIELVEICLQVGVPIESRADDGSTPLHCAARAGQVDAMALLIQEGADLTTRNLSGMTPVAQAIRSHNLDALKVFYDDKVWERVFHTNAIESEHKKLLVKYGTSEMFQAHLNQFGRSYDGVSQEALFLAIHHGNVSLAIGLLDYPNIDVNKEYGQNRRRPIDIATQYNRLEIMRHLIKIPSIDLLSRTRREDTVLHIAAREGHLKMVKLLLGQEKSFINARTLKNESPLHLASFQRHTKVVEYLLSVPGIDTDGKDSAGSTALQLAAFKGRWETVHLLLEHQNARFLQGFSTNLLGTCEPFVRTEVVRRLLKHKDFKDPNIGEPWGPRSRSLLHLAAARVDCELIEILLEHKDINVNALTACKRTPLYQAAECGQVEAVKLLLQHPDIQLDMKDWHGRTSLRIAKVRKYDEIVDLLISYGAKDDEANTLSTITQPTTASNAANTITPQTTSSQPNNEFILTPRTTLLMGI